MSLFNGTEIEQLEQRIAYLESIINKYIPGSGENNRALCPSFIEQPDKQSDSGLNPILHQEQTLVNPRTSFDDYRDRNLKSYLSSDFKAP